MYEKLLCFASSRPSSLTGCTSPPFWKIILETNHNQWTVQIYSGSTKWVTCIYYLNYWSYRCHGCAVKFVTYTNTFIAFLGLLVFLGGRIVHVNPIKLTVHVVTKAPLPLQVIFVNLPFLFLMIQDLRLSIPQKYLLLGCFTLPL